MPNNERRRIRTRTRQYVTYSEEDVDAAIRQVRRGKMSLPRAAFEYGVPRTTLRNKFNGFHCGKIGGQQKISAEWESEIASAIDTLVDWRVPLTGLEVRGLVKAFVDVVGLEHQLFKNDNLPGVDWLRGFLKRNNMTLRTASNVTSARAKVSADTINSYFDELQKELEGIPPSNIFNYDETNLSDDPGSTKVVCRRGLRRVERLMEHSHSSTSIMFCGSADGKYVPPMVVYKVQSGNLYAEWLKGGPRNGHYAATKSGWFDKESFKTWFFEVFLPVRLTLTGPCALIGDNLASHFSPEVIQATIEHDIRFITMPPNSTHLCQPLDVAVFKSLKTNWRNILDRWRRSTRLTGLIPKAQIPALVKELCSYLDTSHLISGFKGSGIYPIDRTQVLKRLRGQPASQILSGPVPNASLTECVRTLLEDKCGPPAKKSRKRGTKVKYGQRIVILADWKENHCFECEEQFVSDSDRIWIGCDHCDNWFHLECSGVDYEEGDYYDIDIESLPFRCQDH